VASLFGILALGPWVYRFKPVLAAALVAQAVLTIGWVMREKAKTGSNKGVAEDVGKAKGGENSKKN